MKIRSSTKLLKLKLIKTSIYKKKFSLSELCIEKTEYQLKKAFQIIYKYHINKKKILFLSFSYMDKIKNLVKKTNHIFLTQDEWLNGNVTNKICTKARKSQKLKNIYDLLVILNSEFPENILKENYKIKIPVIILHEQFKFGDTVSNYSVSGDFSFNKKKIKENFFLNLLKLILKKKKN